MVIKPARALCDNYESCVRLSKEKQEPIFLTRDGEGEMVFLPIELWEKREAEINLLTKLLIREQNRENGAKTFSAQEMRQITEDILHED